MSIPSTKSEHADVAPLQEARPLCAAASLPWSACVTAAAGMHYIDEDESSFIF
jgi:hypothetical protein